METPLMTMLCKIKRRKHEKYTSFIDMDGKLYIENKQGKTLFVGNIYSFVEALMKECNIKQE